MYKVIAKSEGASAALVAKSNTAHESMRPQEGETTIPLRHEGDPMEVNAMNKAAKPTALSFHCSITVSKGVHR